MGCRETGVCRLHDETAAIAGMAKIGAWAIAHNAGQIPPGVGGTIVTIREKLAVAQTVHARLRLDADPLAPTWRETGLALRRMGAAVRGPVPPARWPTLTVLANQTWFAAARLTLLVYGGRHV